MMLWLSGESETNNWPALSGLELWEHRIFCHLLGWKLSAWLAVIQWGRSNYWCSVLQPSCILYPSIIKSNPICHVTFHGSLPAISVASYCLGICGFWSFILVPEDKEKSLGRLKSVQLLSCPVYYEVFSLLAVVSSLFEVVDAFPGRTAYQFLS